MTALPDVSKPVASTPRVQRVTIAERALIGRLLILGQRGKAQGDFERVEDLKFSDFVHRPNGLIFHAMKEITARQEKISVTTVENELSKTLKNSTMRAIEEVTTSYLYELMEGRYGDVEESAKIIREAAFSRNSERLLIEAIETIRDDHMAPTNKAERVLEYVKQIESRSLAFTGKTGTSLYDSVGQFWQRIEAQVKALEHGEVTGYGILTGLNAVDGFTNGFQRGKVYVLVGPTGTGKSALGIKVAKEAMQRGARVGYLPLEMSHDEMTNRMMAIESRIDGSLLQTGRVPKEYMARLAASCKTIQGYTESQQFWYLEFEDLLDLPNINDIRTKVTAHMKTHGADLLIVDQLSVEAMSGTKPNMDEKVILRQGINGLKALAIYYNIPILVMVQPNKSGYGKDGKRPDLLDIAWTSSIANAAYVVMMLYRDITQAQQAVDPMEIIIAKNRGGSRGTGYVNFLPALTDFEDREP